MIELNKVYNESCLETFRKIANNSINLVFCDPPYNVGKDYGDYKDNLTESQYIEFMKQVISESNRISINGIAFYVGSELTRLYMNLIPDAHLIPIHKRAVGIMKGNYFLQYHSLLSNAKPVKKIKDLWDTIRLPGEGYYFRENRFNHPGLTSEKLTNKIIDSFTNEKEIIFDPFMGTGTTAISCMRMNRDYIGSEISKTYIKIYEERKLQCLQTPTLQFGWPL